MTSFEQFMNWVNSWVGQLANSTASSYCCLFSVSEYIDKKLSYRRETARRTISVKNVQNVAYMFNNCI